MMESLRIEETALTPFINFDSATGLMEIIGRSIPENSDEFWMPVLSWFESYVQSANERTVVKISLEYFNISSSKRILFLLYKLNDLSETGKNVCVEWHHRQSDEDMYEVGQDYAYMVKVPFEFKAYEEYDLAIA